MANKKIEGEYSPKGRSPAEILLGLNKAAENYRLKSKDAGKVIGDNLSSREYVPTGDGTDFDFGYSSNKTNEDVNESLIDKLLKFKKQSESPKMEEPKQEVNYSAGTPVVIGATTGSTDDNDTKQDEISQIVSDIIAAENGDGTIGATIFDSEMANAGINQPSLAKRLGKFKGNDKELAIKSANKSGKDKAKAATIKGEMDLAIEGIKQQTKLLIANNLNDANAQQVILKGAVDDMRSEGAKDADIMKALVNMGMYNVPELRSFIEGMPKREADRKSKTNSLRAAMAKLQG